MSIEDAIYEIKGLVQALKFIIECYDDKDVISLEQAIESVREYIESKQ